MKPSAIAARKEPQTTPPVAILTGGRDRPYALGLAESLARQGVSLDFIGSDEVNGPGLRNHPHVRFLNLRGDQSVEAALGRKILRVIVYYVRLLHYAATCRPRLFHILWNNKFEYFDRTLLLLFYRALGKRLLFTAHNVNIRSRDGGDSWLNRLTLRIQYRLVSHIFVHTERMRRELAAEFGVPDNKISVIPFGMNRTVPDTDLSPDAARARLGLNRAHKVVLFFGNIAPYKGLEYLVDAVGLLRHRLPEIRLLLAGRPKGEPEYWSKIRRRIDQLQIASFVVARIEYVPDADTEVYFKAADVLALPYTHIFQSGVLFLGYSFGLPVIATDVGSLKDEVVEGTTGLVCRPADAEDLARCIEKYFAGSLFRALPAGRAEIRRLVERRHSWEEVAGITREAYACVGLNRANRLAYGAGSGGPARGGGMAQEVLDSPRIGRHR